MTVKKQSLLREILVVARNIGLIIGVIVAAGVWLVIRSSPQTPVSEVKLLGYGLVTWFTSGFIFWVFWFGCSSVANGVRATIASVTGTVGLDSNITLSPDAHISTVEWNRMRDQQHADEIRDPVYRRRVSAGK